MMVVRGVRLVRYLFLKENDRNDDDGVTKMVRTTIKSMTKGKTTMRCIGKSLNEFQSNVNDRPTTLGCGLVTWLYT